MHSRVLICLWALVCGLSLSNIINYVSLLFCARTDGYSMADIVYIWARGKGSIGMAKGLELPQFKVVGHKQSFKIETLTTGKSSCGLVLKDHSLTLICAQATTRVLSVKFNSNVPWDTTSFKSTFPPHSSSSFRGCRSGCTAMPRQLEWHWA